jgi:hypothetical protein
MASATLDKVAFVLYQERRLGSIIEPSNLKIESLNYCTVKEGSKLNEIDWILRL